MPARSSFPTVAEQIITFNKNLVDTLNKINSLATTQDPSVTVQILDEQGILREYSLPSFSYLKAEIDRLNNNINSLYNVDDAGALIQTSSQNKYKKIVTVDLNKEPNSMGELNQITTFKSTKNWIFDGLLNPMLQAEFDLSDKVENNVRKCLVRRYIIDFSKTEAGDLTPLGQSALNSFNDLFRNKTNISIDEFIRWHQTTPGIVSGLEPNLDEQVFDLDPNELLYDGDFSVLKTEEDRLNKKLWYHLNTIDYLVTGTGEVRQLAQGDEIIINVDQCTTRYKVIEISTASSNFRVRFERVEGSQPIPVGVGTLKIYSPIVYKKTVKVSIGYNERNVIFIKPLNTENHLLAKNWSLGTGFWSNDLRLSSDDSDNGKTMEQFYIEKVYDYGQVLKDLVAKKIPNSLAGTPTPPSLISTNFKVVQINKHLTDTPDANLIKNKHNQQQNLKSEVQQITEAIQDKQKQLKTTRFTSEAAKNQFNNELDQLTKKKDSKSRLLTTVVNEIIDLSKSANVKVNPKFSVRGFWAMPEAVLTRGTKPQEVVQFRVQYRYLSKDGKETPVETFKITTEEVAPSTGKVLPPTNGAFSNWIEFKTDSRKRVRNEQTGEYTWVIENTSDADTPNINQIDISIQPDEKIEIRVKSISEVGWPESPVESDWSEPIQIEFPDDLKNVLNENDFILKEASQEELKVRMDAELSAKGLDEHLSVTTVINNKTYHHPADRILSGFKDENGNVLDLFEYLTRLENRVKSLEEKIKRAKGELDVSIFRNNQEFVVKNNSEVVFTVDCEDYLDPFSGAGIPTGRVYSNNIYVIKDFLLRVRNKSVDSPLGLLSNRTYTSNPDVYNTATPQVFWVSDQNELLMSSVTGQTRTQLNNQFIWMINYDTINQTTVTKLSENIGNAFTTSNSVTNISGSTEFNLGYNETSILSFIGNNNSLLDVSKWIDNTISIASTTKLLTTIHPVVQDLDKLVETNSDKIKTIDGGDNNAINIPINIYFKMNALDPTQTGLNYQYINLNSANQTVRHVKKLKFFLENEAENRPFVFTIKFNINRNKIALKKNLSTSANPQLL